MAGTKRTNKAEETASLGPANPVAAAEGSKTAEERVNDRESLENYNGDIQDRLIDLVNTIKSDEPPSKESKEDLVEAVVSYIEQQAKGSLSQEKMRAEVRAITDRFEKLAKCPVGEKGTVYRKDTSYYTNQKRILTHRQLSRERREENKSD
ncbi:hypothetical protein HRG_004950 [Hirsutella rhossiliensis]|uniref:Uncharacterized protein n=1 Tax=Hirsutella rhossiliensis TaxID=111463 RepID=A0A9P8N0U4_9HYPO|nr:uncharacterized protein HRG_04950 [Hirsutella rhossiliensis]KAH0964522.1 hypothetical protein HRG_04950 [Hirsutella rhossiliensis]